MQCGAPNSATTCGLKPASSRKMWCGGNCEDGWLVTRLPARAELTLVEPFSCTEMEGTLQAGKHTQRHAISKNTHQETQRKCKTKAGNYFSFQHTSQTRYRQKMLLWPENRNLVMAPASLLLGLMTPGLAEWLDSRYVDGQAGNKPDYNLIQI